MLASEEEKPASGLPYTDMMTEVTTQPGITPASLRSISHRTRQTIGHGQRGRDSQSCCSAIDLSQMSTVASALAPFATGLLAVASQDASSFNTLFNADNNSNNTQRFGLDLGYEYVDMYDYATV